MQSRTTAPTERPRSSSLSTPHRLGQSTRAAPGSRSSTSMLPVERLERLREMVRAQVMQVLRLDAGSPPARHDRLMDLGMDSLMAVQLRNAVNQALALERPLPSTVMFDYPTIDAMAAHLPNASRRRPRRRRRQRPHRRRTAPWTPPPSRR